MIDYFLSGFEGCCLNCPQEERKILCGNSVWCERCLCLKNCIYYRFNSKNKEGYCEIRIELLEECRMEYQRNPVDFNNWLKKLTAQGIQIPKVVRELYHQELQPKLL
jgi:hypothetical protein